MDLITPIIVVVTRFKYMKPDSPSPGLSVVGASLKPWEIEAELEKERKLITHEASLNFLINVPLACF